MIDEHERSLVAADALISGQVEVFKKLGVTKESAMRAILNNRMMNYKEFMTLVKRVYDVKRLSGYLGVYLKTSVLCGSGFHFELTESPIPNIFVASYTRSLFGFDKSVKTVRNADVIKSKITGFYSRNNRVVIDWADFVAEKGLGSEYKIHMNTEPASRYVLLVYTIPEESEEHKLYNLHLRRSIYYAWVQGFSIFFNRKLDEEIKKLLSEEL